MHGEWIREPGGDTSVVFVHGILSSGKSCWRNSNGAYWPELLKQEPELAKIGIYVYTYQTGVYSGNYSISDIVDDLKERLKLDKVRNSHQIVFVCHSMGGIVVRKFIVERILDLKKQNISVGLFLVASPSLGSDFANYVKLLSSLVGNAQAKALGFSQENNWLNDLDKEFQNIKESGELNLDGKELIEDKPIIFRKGLTKQIVGSFSAARYFGDPYKVPGSDHFSIAKPENNKAMQNRLLIEFIKKIAQLESTSQAYEVNAFPEEDPHIPPSSQAPPLKKSSESSEEQIKKWQTKLIQLLGKELKHPGLEPIATSFKIKLKEDFPALAQDCESIARYLVMGEGDRHKQIQQFLNSAKDYPADKSTEEPIKNLMAYLFQILVRKCHDENDQGLSHIPVNQVKSVKLVAAARTSAAYIPNDIDNFEHENGQKNEFFNNIGTFIPETGQLEDVNEICRVIVKELLKGLEKEPDASANDSFVTLKSQLKAYNAQPEDAPFQGLYVKKGLGQNPLQYDDLAEAVAKALREELGDYLWIYLYGGRDSIEWLYESEDDIDGLISRYKREIVKQKTTQQKQEQVDKPISGYKPVNSVFVSYSHDDQALVSDFVTRLKQTGLHVVIDKTHLKPGEAIESFIYRSVKETNATICIVSQKSLTSTWVAMETMNTFHKEQVSGNKNFIACFLENDFFKRDFRSKTTEKIDKEITEINALIQKHNKLKIDTKDLDDEKNRLHALRYYLGTILQRLKDSYSLDIRESSLDVSLEKLNEYLRID